MLRQLHEELVFEYREFPEHSRAVATKGHGITIPFRAV
jgi:hypothetical protein